MVFPIQLSNEDTFLGGFLQYRQCHKPFIVQPFNYLQGKSLGPVCVTEIHYTDAQSFDITSRLLLPLPHVSECLAIPTALYCDLLVTSQNHLPPLPAFCLSLHL